LSVELAIEGIEDELVRAEIGTAVREALRREQGTWIVAVAPSEIRGHWDIGLRGPSAHHFFSIVTRPERLPDLIRHRLKDFLTQRH
jgi:hypothetical protein